MDTAFRLDDVVRALAQTPAALRGLVGGLSEAALNFHEAPDAWSPVQVICHMADGEIADWMPRVRIVMSETGNKTFAPFDREAGFSRYANRPVGALLDEFDRLRAESLGALADLRLTSSDLGRQGIHPEFGAVTLEQLLATWATHDFAHLAQISRSTVRYLGRHVGPWGRYFSLLRDR